MKKYMFFILSLFLIVGCRSGINEDFDGLWVINDIEYQGKNYKEFLQINSLSFDSESMTGKVPGTRFHQRDLHIEWKVKTDSVKELIEIKSKNDVFNGVFSFKFKYGNDEKTLYMKSGTTEISLVKAFK